MAQDIEVKKVRRRRKKTPEELKAGRSAASVSELYKSQVEDGKRLREEASDEDFMPIKPVPETPPKAAAMPPKAPAMDRPPRPAPQDAYPRTTSPAPAGRPKPPVSDISSGTGHSDIEPSGNTWETAPEKPPYPAGREAAEAPDRDAERKSALDSISTFSQPAEEPVKSRKKSSSQKEKPARDKEEHKPEKNIYLEYERQGVGRIPESVPEVPVYKEDEEAHKKRVTVINIAVIVLELIVLGIVLFNLFKYKKLLEAESFDSAPGYSGEAVDTAEETDGQDGQDDHEAVESPATIDFSNDKFALKCTRLQITKDTDSNPAALIFFTFVNKTETPLSMSEVFPPMVVQDDIICETFAQLDSPPDEFYSRDTQIANGEGIDCAYSVKLQNTEDPVTLTIHDNYETYEDVASTVINLQ